MKRIITREQTKKLVRSTKKEIAREEVDWYKDVVLYVSGYNKVRWGNRRKGAREGEVELGINLLVAYEKDDNGNLKRSPLGLMDEYFYRAINSKADDLKREGNLKGKIESFDRELKYFNLNLDEVEGNNESNLVATLYFSNLEGEELKEEYKGKNGRELENDLIDLMSQRGKYKIYGVNTASENDLVMVWVRKDYKPYWEDFMKAVKDFDKSLVK